MLVLTRKANQSIMIGDEIEIIISEIKGDQVKIGVRAPKNVGVYRKEIYEEIREANVEAINSKPDIVNISVEVLKKIKDIEKKNSSEKK